MTTPRDFQSLIDGILAHFQGARPDGLMDTGRLVIHELRLTAQDGSLSFWPGPKRDRGQVFGYTLFDEPLLNDVFRLRCEGWSCHGPDGDAEGFACCVDGDWTDEMPSEELAWCEALRLDALNKKD